MIVYGDHVRRLHPRSEARRLADALATQGATADLFVDAAALVQALLDAEFAARGEVDARSPPGDAAMAALTDLARAILGETCADPAAWRALAAAAPAASVEARLAEGFACYALHPAAYARAAKAAGLGPRTRFVGLRSIGVGLAAVAAAAVGAPPPGTARPVGPPFRRRLRLDPTLAAELGAAPEAVAIVDEGPGLSGSSLLAAAEALEAAGVARGRLVLLPSHRHGPGAQAPEAARRLWRETPRSVVEPDWASELPADFADLLGAPVAPAEDLSGGAWRGAVYADPAAWPAADTFKERRKFRLHTARGAFLLKWAGLGADAREKAERARALTEAGLSPPVLAVRDGWLAQPWIEGRPLSPADRPPLAELTAALALRSRAFPADPAGGADAAALTEMARVNVAEALGPQAGAAAEARVARGLAGASPPRVWIDGRLHPHEWLRTTDGRTLKTDALDHARAHDLVGAQEIGWDVAGAAVEWDLTDGDARRLAEAAGAPPERLPALRTTYLAFQLGAAHMAWEAHGHAPDEQRRLAAARDRYAERLGREPA